MRLAAVCPFVDRRHGTERALAELLDRLARRYGCEIHLYSQHVEDLILDDAKTIPNVSKGAIFWHKVPRIVGPHLLQFVFWIGANKLVRFWDVFFHGMRFDCVFSPGINCLDADVILVHAVFHRLAELQQQATVSGWRALHRRWYYWLLCFLERRLYRRPAVALAAVSHHTEQQLQSYFRRNDISVIPNGVDAAVFSPEARVARRRAARNRHLFSEEERVILLIGNDWRNKGLPLLLEAAAQWLDFPLRLLVVGQDNPSAYAEEITQLGLTERVSFCAQPVNILDAYAAADLYVAPSLEDSFNLPVLEAMSCGLPVIVSIRAGVSEYMQNGVDGILLQNPEDPGELVGAMRDLLGNAARMQHLAEHGLLTAATLSWDRHAASLHVLLSERITAPRP